MLQLLLLRHAKTERTNPAGDHERALVDRGREDARRMGEFLDREGLMPDCAFVSDALRARQTFAGLKLGLGRHLPEKICEPLYLAQPQMILDTIRKAPDPARSLLVVGHNPGLHQLAFDLGQRGPRRLVDALAAKFPTCSLALIESEAENWRDLHASNCRLTRLMTAKALRAHAAGDTDDDS